MTVLTDRQYEYTSPDGETILMGAGTAIRVMTVDGLLSQPEIKSRDIEMSEQHGGQYGGSDYYAAREVVMEVVLEGTDATSVEELLDQLHSVFQVQGTSGILSWKRPDKVQRQVRGRPRGAGFQGNWDVVTGMARGALRLICEDPRVYSEESTTDTTSLPTFAGGRTYDRVYPMIYGFSQTSGAIVVDNAGNFESPPIVRIFGPVDFPEVLHVEQNKSLKLNASLLSSDIYELDLRLMTVVKNGVSSRRQDLAPDSEWWTLQKGLNEIRYLANTVQVGSYIELDWRSAWATA